MTWSLQSNKSIIFLNSNSYTITPQVCNNKIFPLGIIFY